VHINYLCGLFNQKSMARSDLLIKLVQSGSSGDRHLFKKTVQAIIAEEKGKHHHQLASKLEDVIIDNQPKPYINGNGSINGSKNLQVEKLLHKSNPKFALKDLYLEQEILTTVSEFVQEQFRSDLLRSHGLEPRHRILLTGVPGNGKTSLAEAIANELMVPFYRVRYDGIITSYLGETASRLSKLLEFVSQEHCVLFFDEFDAIGKERGDTHETGEIKRLVNSLLLQMDELPSYVVVIAATNHPELLDKAVWRRFQIKIELEKPSEKAIEKVVQDFEKRFPKKFGVSPTQFAKKLTGRSYSEIIDFLLDIQRKYVLSLPEGNLKAIAQGQLKSV
jgi:ATP-dependent 26S proteasome regulatory subunit